MEEIRLGQSAIDNKQPQSSEIVLKAQCRGEVIIGSDDPRDMSLEEFKDSPHLLYHGALLHFQIDRNWTDYTVKKGSSLISGSGFYTTSSREEAEHYSSIRQAPPGTNPKEDLTPVVLEVMPYKAKMYDFTTGNNPKPGVVPDKFLQNFINFLRNTPDNTRPDNNGQGTELQPPAWLQELSKSYDPWQRQYFAEILENISKGMVENIPAEITVNQLRKDEYQNSTFQPTGLEDLDEMEKEQHKDYVIDEDGRYRTKDGKYIVEDKSRSFWGEDGKLYPSAPQGELLRFFLQSKGYDGLITAVGGDSSKLQKPHFEYVFFPGSLDKIGTYDQWKQEKDLIVLNV